MKTSIVFTVSPVVVAVRWQITILWMIDQELQYPLCCYVRRAAVTPLSRWIGSLHEHVVHFLWRHSLIFFRRVLAAEDRVDCSFRIYGVVSAVTQTLLSFRVDLSSFLLNVCV